MNFTSQRTALLALVGSLTGLQTVWADQPRPATRTPARVIALCSLNIAAALGVDERRNVYDPDTETLHDTINGTRRATFSVQVISYDQTNAKQALGYLETLRTRMYSQGADAALKAVNCALWTTGQVIPGNAPVDEHVASIGTLDMFLGMMINESDSTFVNGTETPVTYTWIQTVDATNDDNGQEIEVTCP